MTTDNAKNHRTSGSRPVARSRAARGEQPDARVAWHNLLQVSVRVIREFDRRLDREHRISAREFDVLINLDNAPDRRRGFVRREQDTVDARAFHAELTDAGRALLAEARVTHDAVIHDLFGAHLSATEVDAMTRALARVLGPERHT